MGRWLPGALLLIGEAEALLFDRTAGGQAFEFSQDAHLDGASLPSFRFAIANLPERIDGAVLPLKLRFSVLDPSPGAGVLRYAFGFDRCMAGGEGLMPESSNQKIA